MNYVSTVVVGFALVALVLGFNLALKRPPVDPEVTIVHEVPAKGRHRRAKQRRKAPPAQHAGIAPAPKLLPYVKGSPSNKPLAMPRLPKFHELPDPEDRLLPGYDAQTAVQPALSED